jgi:hypothetical protein
VLLKIQPATQLPAALLSIFVAGKRQILTWPPDAGALDSAARNFAARVIEKTAELRHVNCVVL